jgi:histidine triad (HIT) family protein
MSDCLFCKIVAGEVPADVVRETDTTVAFRDIGPVAPTHVLVIPRNHHENAAALADAEPDTYVQLVKVAREIAEGEQLDGYRLVFNTGASAHQTVFHAHLHVLGGRTMTWPPG